MQPAPKPKQKKVLPQRLQLEMPGKVWKESQLMIWMASAEWCFSDTDDGDDLVKQFTS